MNQKRVAFQNDSGPTVNMIPKHVAKNISPSEKTLIKWNGTVTEEAGTCRLSLRNPKMEKNNVQFTVYDCDRTPVLVLTTNIAMDLIEVH